MENIQEKKETEISFGNLYEINKNLMAQTATPYKKHEIKDNIKKISAFYSTESNHYYMLLNKERSDYTLFYIGDQYDIQKSSFEKDLKECLVNRGEVISIESDGGNAFEIWLKIEEDYFAYYFFPYDNGVIEVC